MGAVEDTRKLAQDFLAPELREVKARIEAFEETTKARLMHRTKQPRRALI